MHLSLLRAFRVLTALALGGSVFAGGVPALAQAGPGGWSPAAGAVGDNTYEGNIDQPSSGATIASGASFTVSGWVVDTTAQGWAGIDGVQITLGNTVLTQASVGLSRPDVAAVLGNPDFTNSGFMGVVSSALPAGAQTLTVVAHTPDKGSWSKQVSINVSGSGSGSGTASAVVAAPASDGPLVLKIISPHQDDVVVSNNNGTIIGVAYDTRTRPELGIGVDRVEAYLDGPRGQAGSQFLGDATFNGTNWSIAWEPTKFNSVQHHILWVYARSTVTGEEVLVQEELNLSR